MEQFRDTVISCNGFADEIDRDEIDVFLPDLLRRMERDVAIVERDSVPMEDCVRVAVVLGATNVVIGSI